MIQRTHNMPPTQAELENELGQMLNLLKMSGIQPDELRPFTITRHEALLLAEAGGHIHAHYSQLEPGNVVKWHDFQFQILDDLDRVVS